MKPKYERGQYSLTENDFQEGYHPSAFMNMIKSRAHTSSSAKDERCQVLPSRVIWDGNIGQFEEFKNKVEEHYQNMAQFIYLI
jgi:hypothetical protein